MASIMQQHRPECVDGPFHQTEMESTSDDTPSLKRKSISLNAGDGGNDGYLPSVSTMSREDKREYRKRLRMDLKQLQGITMKLDSLEQQVRFSDKEVSSVPPPLDLSRLGRQSSFITSDGLGTPGNKEKRTPKANQMYSNSEYISAKDKMPPPEKLRPKTFTPKKGPKGELDSKRLKIEAARQKRMGDLMKMCGTVLKKLMTHKHAWVFNTPVDVVGLGLPDYFKVISKPMDLGTIKKRLDRGEYHSPLEFADDVKQTFWNAMTYNPPGHDVHLMAKILKQLFEDRWRGIKEKLDEEHVKCRAEDEVLAGEQQQSMHLHNRIDDQQSSLTKKQGAGTPRGTLKKSGKKEMSYDQKTELGKNLETLLETLPPEKVEKIIQIIRKQHSTVSQDDTLEVDIDSIDIDTLWELHKAVDGLMRPKTKKKPGPKPQEPASESAPKSTVIAPGQGGEGVEEDVDIDVDDNDTPAVFPPVVIDKDTNDGSKSSGGSSSSSSGSSSSESDSGSSSGSDSEAEGPRPGAQKPAQKDSVVTEPVTESPEEPDVVQNGDVAETQAEKSGEKPQSDRPVSPEKSLRAALLKGRFADTILKAREKTFPLKSDNVDPEKLRKDKEELEKKQREDRARLQAEAKAAELARKKAEAEAEAEAKKKREIEREAARRALQQMERTVDLDAHCEILKDFDLMRSSSMEHFQSSAGEVSPAPDGLNFVLPSAGQPNPLHNLGLFMKLDADEEEEEEKQGDGEVAYVEGTDENGEVEEGEID